MTQSFRSRVLGGETLFGLFLDLASPIAAECLKPWPEQAETTVTPSTVGWRSTTKRPSGRLV